jgi:imidazole glycerol-phosphate synthase subunit HisH
MRKTVIVDSGCANLNSIYRAAIAAGINAVVTDNKTKFKEASAIIFPGVGSFEHAMNLLEDKGLTNLLHECINSGKPFLGICLGMQLLFEASEESAGNLKPGKGLGALEGKSVRFPADLPVPHVGWNQAKPVINHPLFAGLDENAYFYFTHSYYVIPDYSKYILTKTDYGFDFTSAVCKDNLLGVQFHPEKSGPSGLRLLSNFGKIIADKQQ